jgi:hypothetical protein
VHNIVSSTTEEYKINDQLPNTIAIDSLANTKEKTPMCLVNELARYNKVIILFIYLFFAQQSVGRLKFKDLFQINTKD